MLIFPTGAKAHNWYGGEEGEKIGHQAMSDEDLQGFVEIGEVELEEGLPEEENIEVSDGEFSDEVEIDTCDELPCEEEGSPAELIEDIKEDLDALAEMVEVEVIDGDDGSLEIADEEVLETTTVPIEDEIAEEIGEAEESEEESMSIAGVSGRWVKIAKLSPENQKKTKEYWLMLGFPKDYVDAMVKDYE